MRSFTTERVNYEHSIQSRNGGKRGRNSSKNNYPVSKAAYCH